MHIVSNDFIAYNNSLINLLLVIIAILLVTLVALTAYALTAAGRNQELDEEVKYLERRINRLNQQNKTINK